jgi:hypothetical protein
MNMAEQRKVEVLMNAVDVSRIAETVGYNQLQAAIGYLSMWNYTFPAVRIMSQDKCDLLAVYLTEDDKTGYVIGAIWSETDGKYSFHS